MQGRVQPSVSKINYLQHCEDCAKRIKQACNVTADQVAQFRQVVDSKQVPSAVHVLSLVELEEDYRYLADSARAISKKLQPLRASIKDQLEISDSWRSRAIGLLVAIYVPLAFVSVRTSSFRVYGCTRC